MRAQNDKYSHRHWGYRHFITYIQVSVCVCLWRRWWLQYIIIVTLFHFNPLRAKFFIGNITNVARICIIPPQGHGTCGWYPSSCKTRTYLFYIVNIICTDVLATQGARASATMILAMLKPEWFGPFTLRVNTCWFQYNLTVMQTSIIPR